MKTFSGKKRYFFNKLNTPTGVVVKRGGTRKINKQVITQRHHEVLVNTKLIYIEKFKYLNNRIELHSHHGCEVQYGELWLREMISL